MTRPVVSLIVTIFNCRTCLVMSGLLLDDEDNDDEDDDHDHINNYDMIMLTMM